MLPAAAAAEGGGGGGGGAEGERAAAATRIQSVQRGRAARQQVEAMKASGAQRSPAVASAADDGDAGATVDAVVDEAAETAAAAAAAAAQPIQDPAAPELAAGECKIRHMIRFSSEFRPGAERQFVGFIGRITREHPGG